MNLYDLLLSSTGEGLAKRAKSFVGMAVAVGLWAGVSLNPEGLGALADQLGPLLESVKTVISGLLGIWSFVQFIDGWIRAKSYRLQGLGKYAR